MRMILLLTVLGMILVTVGLVGLYVSVCRRLNRINKKLREHDKSLGNHGRSIKALEDKNREKKEHFYFSTDNELDEERPDIKYGGEGI